MSSPRSVSTPSEGEIVEDISDSEKATTTSLPSVSGTSVNRQSRTTHTTPRGLSPAIGNHSARTSFSIRPPKRQRSRSPYRDLGGEKRRRDDYMNGRNHGQSGSRFDNGNYGDRRQPKPYEDLDRPASGASNGRFDDGENKRYHDKRRRSRSRSPFRHHRHRSEQSNRDRRDRSRSPYRSGRVLGQGGAGTSDGPAAVQQSVSGRGRPSVVAQNKRQETEFRSPQVQQEHNKSSRMERVNRINENGHIDKVNAEEPQPVDEATLIEDRRRRREAIKAKYRGQATPLLVQALQLGSKTGSSTSSAAGAVESTEPKAIDSAQSSPPQSPRETEPVSPVLSEDASGLQSGEDLLKPDTSSHKHPSQPNGDESSAADYDPTMDMKDDRLKQDRFLHDEEMSSTAYDETQPQLQQALVSESRDGDPVDPGAANKVEDAFDMFAEDFDEEIEPSAPITTESMKEKEVNLGNRRKGKQLDAILLDNWDDPEGYYRVILGELLDNRYNVEANLGKGMFSAVVRATDMTSNELVAIKIVRSNFTMKKAGMKEIEILQQLAAADPDDKKHMIRFRRHFEHKGHLCMVFENLSMNLREVLKKFGRDVGINIRAVRTYAQQIFLAASLLRKCNILHADLKPDNILVNETHTSLKICDLGSAAPFNASDEITPYLVSRFYRAPEIILGIIPDAAIDMWSIGCTLFELYTGKILFTGRNNNQMLKSMIECRGRFPTKVLKRAQFASVYFDEMGSFSSIEKDKVSGNDVRKVLTLNKPVAGKDLKARLGLDGEFAKRMGDADLKELNLFRDLLEKCLDLNPERRCTPSEALKHPFILRSKA